jgi:hypothetical protein
MCVRCVLYVVWQIVEALATKPYLLIEDLTQSYHSPAVMDIKMGARSHPTHPLLNAAMLRRMRYTAAWRIGHVSYLSCRLLSTANRRVRDTPRSARTQTAEEDATVTLAKRVRLSVVDTVSVSDLPTGQSDRICAHEHARAPI